MPDENTSELVKIRLEKARSMLVTAQNNIDDRDSLSSINRSYYGIFTAIRAVLALQGFDSKKHSGVISKFRSDYIKTGVFPPEMSDTINKLFDSRNSSDYDDFADYSIEFAQSLLDEANDFVDRIEKFLKAVVG